MTSMKQQQESKPKPIKKAPQKVTQLECYSTNTDLTFFFIESLNDSFKYLPNLLSKIYMELELIINFAEYRLTVAKSQPHQGDLLQNIMYTQQGFSQTKKLIYLILTVIVPYIKKRVHNYVLYNSRGWRQKLLNLLNIIDKIISILDFINYAVFLYKGEYRSLVQRLLKIKMEFINKQNSRILNFTLMNRKMIWSIYELFLKTMLPYAHRYFSKILKNIFYLTSYLQVESSEPNCVYCGETPSMALKAQQCEHLGCYYCVMTGFNFDTQQVQKCPKCGQKLQRWKKPR